MATAFGINTGIQSGDIIKRLSDFVRISLPIPTTSLLSCNVFQNDAATSVKNWVEGVADLTVVGTPVFNADGKGVVVSKTNCFVLPFDCPQAATYMVIAKPKNLTGITSGAILISNYNNTAGQLYGDRLSLEPNGRTYRANLTNLNAQSFDTMTASIAATDPDEWATFFAASRVTGADGADSTSPGRAEAYVYQGALASTAPDDVATVARPTQGAVGRNLRIGSHYASAGYLTPVEIFAVLIFGAAGTQPSNKANLYDPMAEDWAPKYGLTI